MLCFVFISFLFFFCHSISSYFLHWRGCIYFYFWPSRTERPLQLLESVTLFSQTLMQKWHAKFQNLGCYTNGIRSSSSINHFNDFWWVTRKDPTYSFWAFYSELLNFPHFFSLDPNCRYLHLALFWLSWKMSASVSLQSLYHRVLYCF